MYYLLWFDTTYFICCDLTLLIVFSMRLSQKIFLKLVTHKVDLAYILSVPHLRLSGVEVMQRLVLRRSSLVKEGRQSYSIVLYDVLVMTSHHTFKESIGKVTTS